MEERSRGEGTAAGQGRRRSRGVAGRCSVGVIMDRDHSQSPETFPADVRAAWPSLRWDRASTLGGGLINTTWLVPDDVGGEVVVQRVSAIFDPRIHENIVAVTHRLSSGAVETCPLVSSSRGDAYVRGCDGGVYRVMERLEGGTLTRWERPEQARAAGRVLASFHGALWGMSHDFVGTRAGVHDTQAHLRRLKEAVQTRAAHRLHEDVKSLAEGIAAAISDLPPLDVSSRIIGHGDPKTANLMVREDTGLPYALVDLDTVGPIALGHELGDALRSWCNAASEDDPAPRLDLDLHAAAVEGYVTQARQDAPAGDEAVMGEAVMGTALVDGLPWICLELCARFAADALEESYFGWDPSSFPGRGEHNLHRARGQWGLARQVLDATARRRDQVERALATQGP